MTATKTTKTQHCSQCGRTGTRGFTTLTAKDVLIDGGGLPIVICANKTACMKRWPRPARDDN